MGLTSFIKKISRNGPKFIDEISDLQETLSLIKKKLKDDRSKKEITELKSNIKNTQQKNMVLFIVMLSMILFELIQ